MCMTTKPRPSRARPSVSDTDLLDLTPLLHRRSQVMCPLCGFPRTLNILSDEFGEAEYFSCETCWNDVRRADLIRRRKISPSHRNFD